MSTERETARVVRSWLETGAMRLPDRVLDAVLDQVPATPQRRPFWRAWRFPQMTNPVRYAIAAAAVLVVALVGYQFLPTNKGPVGNPATPSPTALPTPAPTVVPSLPTSGQIPAGTYRMGRGPTIMVTVPAGWVSVWDGMGIRKHYEQPNELTAVHLWSPGLAVFTDACDSADTAERIGPTVDDLISALRAQENSELADPVDTTIAGIDGTRLELSSPSGLDLSQCSLEGYLQVWEADLGGYVNVGSDPSSSIVYVADTPAGRLHLATWVPDDQGGVPAAATAADNAEREGIWASLEYVE